MKAFLKYVFATFMGLFLFSLFCFGVLFMLISASVPEIRVEDNSVLSLRLDKRIIERETGNLFTQLSRSVKGGEPGTIGLLELRQAIQAASKSDKVKGVFLNVTNLDAGTATLEELRGELIRFKESGKFVVAYAEMYTELGYYLASVADKIYLPSSGILEFNGIHTELVFFKRLLDKLRIEPEVFKVGQYKSAVEPFISEQMSAANRDQISALLNSVYDHMLDEIGVARGLEVTRLRAIADDMLVRTPEDALHYGLITDIGYKDEVETYMKSRMGLEDSEALRYTDYWSLLDLSNMNPSLSLDKIAVIYAVGDIQDGKGDDRTIGSETMMAQLKEAREDSSIKAIVLRINSPGGSALASDVIWREVALTTKIKPVIASMGDVAASGGYYIAAGCDSIVADPTTITGSIGVFGVLFNGQDFLNDKLYLSTDREKTGKYADIGSFTRPLDARERVIIQKEVEDIYAKFLTVVADGRKLDTAYVHQVAQGRVWSGSEAKVKKLVDVQAGLDKAVEIAAGMAKLEDYHLVHLPERPNLFISQLFAETQNRLVKKALEEELGDLYPWIKAAKDARKMSGVQARLPLDIQIK